MKTNKKNKKRNVSKKTKRAWRKHVDVKDVDAFLDNVRFEERLGPPISEKPDSELFAVDTNKESTTPLTKKQRRLLLKTKEPKCFTLLKSHTLVPDPISKRNRVRTREERKDPIAKRKEAQRKAKGILKLKERVALKNKTLANIKRANRPKRGEFNDDIWGKENSCPVEVNTEWLSTDTIKHTLSHLGMKKKNAPKSVHKKTSVLPAVEAPHPGTSYNPSYADHQQLLHQVAQKELELMKQEAHLDRVTTNMFRKISQDEKESNIISELSEGLPSIVTDKMEEDVDMEGNVDDDQTVKSVNPPVKNVKKTLVQRRKLKGQKDIKHKLTQEKVEKKKLSDIYRLRLLQKQLDSKEKKLQLLHEKRLKKKMIKSVETKTLSRVKFEPLDPDFKLTEELTGNLRNATPSGNLLKDRYKSLQQRNIIPPGTLVLKHNKAKVKKYKKADHKMKWENT